MQGILFDLDGTLLDVDVNAFLRRYFRAIQAAVGPRFPGVEFMPSILASTEAMQSRHSELTNRQAFFRDFLDRTGVDIGENWGMFEDFYRDVFPTLGEGYGPAAGAREAVEAARSLGLKVAVATQPIFPRIAIEHRLAWAGMAGDDFDAVTSYETMHACKPQAAYFRETCALMGCEPRECLMIGDDRGIDMPAADAGLRTFYVGRDAEAAADFRGTLEDVPALLEQLTRSDTERDRTR